MNIFYCAGGLVFTTFLFQFLTGAALTIFFRPSVLDSLLGPLCTRFDYGWFARGLHRLSSNFVFFFMILHVSRVFFTGGQARPRELTWISGAALAVFASAFGVSGYTLPWDGVGFWAYQIVSAIPASLDLYYEGAGTLIVDVLRGGRALGQFSLSRCYFAHTLLFPLLTLLALALHLILIRKMGISGPWK